MGGGGLVLEMLGNGVILFPPYNTTSVRPLSFALSLRIKGCGQQAVKRHVHLYMVFTMSV